MTNARTAIANIESMLAIEIEEAALKRDLNKMVLALTSCVKELVIVSTEVASLLDNIRPTETGVHISGDVVVSGNIIAQLHKTASTKRSPRKKVVSRKPKVMQKKPINLDPK